MIHRPMTRIRTFLYLFCLYLYFFRIDLGFYMFLFSPTFPLGVFSSHSQLSKLNYIVLQIMTPHGMESQISVSSSTLFFIAVDGL